MKNIALCIANYFSNRNGDNLLDSNYVYDNIINNIIPENNLDIFIHSFDIKNKDQILQKYPSVIDYIIEPQIDFNTLLDSDNKKLLELLTNNPDPNGHVSILNTLSMLYSRKQSILLANTYSQSKNKKYDCIIFIRFDIGVRVNCDTEPGYNLCHLLFDINDIDNYVKNDYIVSSYWNQLNAGLSDFWFFSNHNNMLLFAMTYDYVLHYAFKLNSDYLNAFLTNWPDSNKHNEFSNEIINLKHNNTKPEPYTCLINYTANSHYLYKYYFIVSGLYTKCKYKKNKVFY